MTYIVSSGTLNPTIPYTEYIEKCLGYLDFQFFKPEGVGAGIYVIHQNTSLVLTNKVMDTHL